MASRALPLLALLASAALGLPERVAVPPRTTFVNNAWGFPNGGPPKGANVTGRLLVIEDLDGVSAQAVAALKQQGHIVQCYFSVGTVETWRPDYTSAWKAIEVPGGLDPNWGEYWIDLRKLAAIQTLMTPRFKRAKALGCDAIEADNVDCYQSPYCQGKMGLSQAKVKTLQIAYNLWQLNISHSLGLSLSLKNAPDLLSNAQLLAGYDFAVNEQCFYYQECNLYAKFIRAGKAVLNTEYDLVSTVCASAAAANISTEQCAGSNNNGLCNGGSTANWKLCQAAQVPLPSIQHTNV